MNPDKTHLYDLDLTEVTWRKASKSGSNGDCVEVTDLPYGAKAVRDSKNPHLTALRYTAAEWDAFRQGIITGEL